MGRAEKILIKALEFYANPNNWYPVKIETANNVFVRLTLKDHVATRRARDAIKEFEDFRERNPEDDSGVSHS